MGSTEERKPDTAICITCKNSFTGDTEGFVHGKFVFRGFEITGAKTGGDYLSGHVIESRFREVHGGMCRDCLKTNLMMLVSDRKIGPREVDHFIALLRQFSTPPEDPPVRVAKALADSLDEQRGSGE